jgi:hypothetical protein
MAEPRTLTAVVCATHQQFRNWCIDNDRSPRDPSLRLVTELHHARGCQFDKVIGLGQREPGLIAATYTRLRPESTA